MSHEFVLKRLKRSDYSFYGELGLLLFGCMFMALRFADFWETQSVQSIAVKAFIFSLILMPGLILVRMIGENFRNKREYWKFTDSESVEKSKFGSKTLSLSEPFVLKYDIVSLRLERGSRIVTRSGLSAFVPQETDRYFDAIQFLKNHPSCQRTGN